MDLPDLSTLSGTELTPAQLYGILGQIDLDIANLLRDGKLAALRGGPDQFDGKIEFSVDQQPYVQGYMAVESLWLNITNGNDMGGGQPVRTGPSVVDKTNIDQILPYTANNTR